MERSASMRQYGAGVVAGFEITLKLMLGEDDGHGEPYRGPIPPELREWAEAALAAIEANRQ